MVFRLLLPISSAWLALGSRTYERSLEQAWGQALGGGKARDTPVTRAVNLLKEMQSTLQKEMEEDEALYDKLACWCNENEYGKGESISASEAKIAELESTIEALAARKENLKTSIKELEDELKADKSALEEATAVRDKQLKEFHGNEMDAIQAIEALKAAVVVLSKHQGKTKSTVAGGAVFKSEKDSWESLLSIHSKQEPMEEPWTPEHTVEHLSRTLDNFMSQNGFDNTEPTEPEHVVAAVQQPKLLQNDGSSEEWTAEDAALVRKALKSASAFMQAHHRSDYYPAYQSQSGEIFGVLKQLQEEMEQDLSESQKREQARAAAFAELKAAKTEEIRSGEKSAETKEDELATTVNNLAEAKEDLAHEKKSLAADQTFMANLKETCEEADKNFEERKSARMQEIKAVSEAIDILTEDDARDAMTGTYNFLQGNSISRHEQKLRKKAAAVLRKKSLALKEPTLSILATGVELDAFTKVKKAIDDMIAQLKTQQADEVKKNDFCTSELHENEMTTAKTEDAKTQLEAKSNKLASDIQTLTEEVKAAKEKIESLQYELQRANEDRQKEHLEYQKTVADQTTTQEVLKRALNKLAAFYDNAFIQNSKQTPPVPQMEYKPNKGANGAMELLEKLIQEAQTLIADSIHSENDAQTAYGEVVADTNTAVDGLNQEINSKQKAKVAAEKEKAQTDSDIKDTAKELEGLEKYNTELHADCDYVMKNFGARQEARGQEIEALQQAKQILSGASFN